ncbi:TNF receptor-associated factor 5-like [Dysidea avara]|uniref:TNF receptor-associated factor 5-like n=1 Tax=Dysidea avara TaxID=196820 RepID=UPI003324416D
MVDDVRSSRVQNFEIHFIDVLPKEFDCPICLETLKNPFAIECCRHHFCDACINYAKGKKNECPLCKANPIKGALDNQFKRAINKASVYCSRRSEGCKWEGRFDSLNNHLSLGQLNGQCKHVMLNCPYMKCKISMSRHQMIDHVKACQYRPFACPHCGYEGAHAEIVKMHYEICSMYPLVCPNNCSQKTFKRGELPGHLDTCPNAMVCCPFVNLGCKVKTKRCILKRHVDSDGSQHGFLVSSAINDLHKENKLEKESLEVKVSVLENKCSQLEKDFFAALNMYEQNEVKRDNFVASLFEQNSILESNLSSLYIKNAQLKNDLYTAYVDLKTSLSTRCSILEDQFGKLKNQLTSSIRQVAIREREIKNLYDNCLHKTNISLRSRTDLTVDTSDEGNTALRTSLNILAAKHASLEEKVNNNIQDVNDFNYFFNSASLSSSLLSDCTSEGPTDPEYNEVGELGTWLAVPVGMDPFAIVCIHSGCDQAEKL